MVTRNHPFFRKAAAPPGLPLFRSALVPTGLTQIAGTPGKQAAYGSQDGTRGPEEPPPAPVPRCGPSSKYPGSPSSAGGWNS